jgi:hypothetical protein
MSADATQTENLHDCGETVPRLVATLVLRPRQARRSLATVRIRAAEPRPTAECHGELPRTRESGSKATARAAPRHSLAAGNRQGQMASAITKCQPRPKRPDSGGKQRSGPQCAISEPKRRSFPGAGLAGPAHGRRTRKCEMRSFGTRRRRRPAPGGRPDVRQARRPTMDIHHGTGGSLADLAALVVSAAADPERPRAQMG